VLKQVFAGEAVDFEGETVTAKAPGPSTVGGDVPVIVAAMGPQALKVTAELADGTLPFLAGPRALSELIVPTMAGKRIIAAVPAVVTDEPDEVRKKAVEQMSFYGQIPSYRRILDAEGVGHAADLAIIGDEKTVLDGLQRYYDAGATDVLVSQTGIRSSEERRRTWEVVSSFGS
jgi:alkanesulfonate monooxygenase SsuD/methylene tetrahydromethanopterin reductase-like flavin-dependent oxidoreductase (luciferase family)